MPDRMIRESALLSESLGSVSAEAERLFWRLTVAVDDYGRFSANPTIIKGRCLALVRMTERQIEVALDELAAVGSVRLYEAGSKKYLAFVNWCNYQRKRDSKPKFPAPPQIAANCGELPQVAASSESESESESEGRETRQDSRKNLSASQKSGAPIEWPATDVWLKNFIDHEQKTFNGTHIPYLLEHEWWDLVSEACNGIDKPFLGVEFAKMHAWLKENPARAPTPRGVRKFVRGWLERAADRARRQA